MGIFSEIEHKRGYGVMRYICLFLLLLSQLSHGAQQQVTANASPGLTGIVFNETRSPLAKSFFQQFSNQWDNRPIAKTVNISIEERHSARWGTQVLITFRGQILFRTSINNRIYSWANVMEQALSFTESGVTNGLRVATSPDLASDEI